MIAIELTCCFETNLIKSRKFKVERYEKLEEDCLLPDRTVTKIFVEVTSLGFISKNIKDFTKLCKKSGALNIKRLLNKMSEVAIRASYYLYTQRNNNHWVYPAILKFY